MAKRPIDIIAPDGPADPGKRETLKTLAALGALALVDAGALAGCGRRVRRLGGRERKLIILGLDGIDPRGVARLIAKGQLPNLRRLRETGGFRSLGSSIPPESPVAWATFITGRDPGGHGIYDFVERDPKTLLPYLSIARTEPPTQVLSAGKWRLPLAGGKVELLRRGEAFWDVLAAQGVPGVVYRAPSNYPPQDNGVRQLAGLGAPDLLGTYGEFSYYTDDPAETGRTVSGGAIHAVSVGQGRVYTTLTGPENTLRQGTPATAAELTILVDPLHRVAKIVLGKEQAVLQPGEWSDWLTVRFELIPHAKSVTGIVRFFLKEVSPHLKVYATPVNIDPRAPALPITAPEGWSQALARQFGLFYTQGFPHDVKALRHGLLDDEEYLQQSGLAFGEEKRMWEAALHDFNRGLLFYYFATTDRTQHMFWRTMDPRHPAYSPLLAAKLGEVIPDCYRAADAIVGQAMEACDDDTTLIVMSDHGFNPYYRSFHLNTWLTQHNYLTGIERWTGDSDIFANADWQNTLAYGLGFNSLFLNLRGREPNGVVGPEEQEALAQQLVDDLQSVRDPETGERIVQRVYRADEVYSPHWAAHAPDLIIGYARGYRCSDESVLGEVATRITAANTDKWSGDHCVDRSLVPGVLFSNKSIRTESPELRDVTASVLAEFGVKKPAEMTGEPVW